jgi:hypothetical protein
MKGTHLYCIRFAVLLGLAIGTAAPAQVGMNLVLNGNFATGDFTSWTLGGDSAEAFVTSGQLTGFPFQAALTTGGDDNGSLGQSLTTVSGQQYTFSFLLGADGSTDSSTSFSATLGSGTLESLMNADLSTDTLGAGTLYTLNYTATSATTLLSFAFDDAPGFLYLTNVSLVASPSVVPEPSTLVGVGTGVPMLMGYLRRKQRTSTRA